MEKRTVLLAVMASLLILNLVAVTSVSATHKPVKVLVKVKDATTNRPLGGIECSIDEMNAVTNRGGVAKVQLTAGTPAVDVTCGSTTMNDVPLKKHGTTVVRVLIEA
jgi:hypothetical protein